MKGTDMITRNVSFDDASELGYTFTMSVNDSMVIIGKVTRPDHHDERINLINSWTKDGQLPETAERHLVPVEWFLDGIHDFERRLRKIFQDHEFGKHKGVQDEMRTFLRACGMEGALDLASFPYDQ